VAQAIYDSAHWVGSIQERVFHGTNLKREREALESKFKEQRCLNVENWVSEHGNILAMMGYVNASGERYMHDMHDVS
jgi:hypothetical protein